MTEMVSAKERNGEGGDNAGAEEEAAKEAATGSAGETAKEAATGSAGETAKEAAAESAGETARETAAGFDGAAKGAVTSALLCRRYPGGAMFYRLFCEKREGKDCYGIFVRQSGGGKGGSVFCRGISLDRENAFDVITLLFRECVFPCHIPETIDQTIGLDREGMIALYSDCMRYRAIESSL